MLGQGVDWLLEQAGKAWDLSGFLVVVPTAQAGRRLRQELALRAGEQGTALFSPRVVEPEGLLRELGGETKAATRLQCLVVWAEVLREADLEQARSLFPVDPPQQNFAWGARIGQQLLGLQQTLAERGLRFADVAARGELAEQARWEDLARLEAHYHARLGREERADPQMEKVRAAHRPALPDKYRRVVLLGTPDPLTLAIMALEALAAAAPELPIDVVVFAPEAEQSAFDAWGRPLTAVWMRRPIEWNDFDRQVHLLADPAAQAKFAAEVARSYRKSAKAEGEARELRAHEAPPGALGNVGGETGARRPGEGGTSGADASAPLRGARREVRGGDGASGDFAVGVGDGAVTGALQRALRAAGMAGFDPQGRPRSGERFGHLVACLADWAGEPTFAAIEALGRAADVLEFLRARGGAHFSCARWLAGLDALRREHLPPNLAEAKRHAADTRIAADYPELGPGLAALESLRAPLRGRSFADEVGSALATLFAARRLAPDSAEDAVLVDSAKTWMDLVRGCGEEEARGGLTPPDAWDLALRLYGELRRTEEKAPDAVELLGWIELLWEDAPHLIVLGLNEGAVPTAIVGDPFLPESLRRALGLKTNDDRLARDAYLLQALGASRANRGRLEVLVGKVSADGEPLRPSRLLFQCSDALLRARVAALFRALPPAGPPLGWRRAWKLAPDRAQPGWRPALGVTALRDWLACPFRFCLKHGLQMQPVDATKSEMEATDFGTLCHGALEALGRNAALAGCADAAVLRDFLLAELEQAVARKFGRDLTLPLLIQVESARQRLVRAAHLQALEHAAGWRIHAVERRIELEIAGVKIVARIDRIDRHEATGAYRVLDYKTSDDAVDPADAHLRKLRRGEEAPAWMQWEGDRGPLRWKDLQLPLYRHALAAEFPGLSACGYFNLPKAVGASALAWWEPYSLDLQASALACAEGVCRAIAAGEFWPPNPDIDPRNDDFAPLFHHGADASVDWKGVPR